jgi:hypothetical protein
MEVGTDYVIYLNFVRHLDFQEIFLIFCMLLTIFKVFHVT